MKRGSEILLRSLVEFMDLSNNGIQDKRFVLFGIHELDISVSDILMLSVQHAQMSTNTNSVKIINNGNNTIVFDISLVFVRLDHTKYA